MTTRADGNLVSRDAPHFEVLEVRRAEPRDASWLDALALAVGLGPSLGSELELVQARVYVVDPERGFLSVWIVQDEMQIQDLAVAPGSRRRGLGRALLDRAVAEAQAEGVSSATLEVRESNSEARGFYHALGFGEVGRRPRYYSNGEAAFLLSRPLEGK